MDRVLVSFFDTVVLQRVREDSRLAAFLPATSRVSGGVSSSNRSSGTGGDSSGSEQRPLGALGEYANLAEVSDVLMRVVRGRPDLVHRVLPAGGLVSVLYHFSATFQQTKVAVDRLQRKSKVSAWTVADSACCVSVCLSWLVLCCAAVRWLSVPDAAGHQPHTCRAHTIAAQHGRPAALRGPIVRGCLHAKACALAVW